jgi:large subunit ribosomal protein L10
MPSESALKEKQEIVLGLNEKLEKAKSAILVDYRGLTVEEDTDLRSKLKKANIEYKVIKNTYLVFAAKNNGLDELVPFLSGPTGIAISYDDEIAPSKVLFEYSKSNEKLELKAGVIDGKIVNVNEIKALASLPPKDVLIAKALGSMKAPISGLVNVLNANVRGLVVALNAIAQQKQ